jgi:hypothetical protein
MMMQQHFVSVPHEFFQKSKNDYADWRFAFFRELMQNSEDAFSTRVDFMIEETEFGCRVSARDDGHGMSEDVLLTKFMALRESTKKGSGSAGGFGVAKEIIAFAHNNYRIETQNIVLEGVGGRYSYRHEATGDGVKIIVEMEESASVMMRTLKYWCSLSSQKSKVFLNGEQIKGSPVKFNHKMSVPFGDIAFKDNNDSSEDRSTLIVKMQGMAMFVRHIYTDGGSFVAELNLQGASVDLLLSSRDGLSGTLESTLTEILNQLANNRSRLKLSEPITYEFNHRSEEFGSYPLVTPDEVTERQQNALSETLYTGKEVKALAESVDDLRDFQEKSGELAEKLSRAMMKKEYKSHDSILSKIDDAIHGVDQYEYPQNWIVRVGASDDGSTQKLIKRLTLKKYIRLAHTWRIVTNYVLTSSSRYRGKLDNYGNVNLWGKIVKCGFLMDNARALCVEEDDSYQILVNPFNTEDDFHDDFTTLVEFVVHECAHLDGYSHGDYFVTTMQSMMQELRRHAIADKNLRGYGGMNRLENMVEDQLKQLI